METEKTGNAAAAVDTPKGSIKSKKNTCISRKVSSMSIASGKSSNKCLENIKQLETSRSNKDVHICECPPVDMTCQPDEGAIIEHM